ncbi:hypothetical protein EDC94DRAFT_498436, partial [Helicostylum pulchrum]
VDAYNQYELSYATSFGDIKVENATDFGKFVDFYRLGIFRKKALEIYSLTVVLLFPTIGTRITSYCLTRKSGFLNFIEVASITISSTKRDVVTLISFLDDMLTVTCL